ncbi:MAG: M28 family peptidase [bacterium]
MNNRTVLVVFMILLTTLPLISFAQSALFEESALAWDAGNYIKALKGFKALMQSPDWQKYKDEIALTTGELYPVQELTTDGRRVRFSPDGRYAAFEFHKQTTTITSICFVADHFKQIDAIETGTLVFSPITKMVAYLSVTENDELQKARADTSQAGRGRQRVNPIVAYLEAKNSRLVVRDLMTLQTRTLETGNLLIVNLTYSADGKEIYFTAGVPGDSVTSSIYAIPEQGGTPRRLSTKSGFYTNPVAIAGGRFLMYTQSTRNPIPQSPTGQPRQSGRGQAMMGFSGMLALPTTYILHNLHSDSQTTISANSLSASRNGSSVIFSLIDRNDRSTSLNLLSFNDSLRQKRLFKTDAAISSFECSPNGRSIIFSMMTNDDYEIYTIGVDSTNPTRLTREIQHDRFPQFITDDLVLYIKGEPRHMRSYLRTLSSNREVRLFHNNTLRTISPEYEWSVCPDGAALLITAERDGNTISPERGVYALDLTRTVTCDELLRRIDTNVQAEQNLRARGEQMFKAIAKKVKSAVNRISITRIFEYEQALYELDTKYITQPGNKKAIDYLSGKLKSFGYEPEIQWFDARGTKTANVLAILRGTTHPDVVYVLSAHFDSGLRTPGADDNTSGTVTVLETARVLRNHPMPATIIFAFFTGEEAGLFGSMEFVKQAQAKKIYLAGALNNDMVGWSENHRLDNTIRYSNPGIRDVQHAAAFLFSNLITYDAVYYKATDAAAYYDTYGDIVGGIGSYPVLASPYYHQPTDLLPTINHQLIMETTKATAASIMMLAAAPSRLNNVKIVNQKGTTAEVTWNPAPEKDIRKYIIVYGPAEAPEKFRAESRSPTVTLKNITKGTTISVKAVNARGIESWDWARMAIEK